MHGTPHSKPAEALGWAALTTFLMALTSALSVRAALSLDAESSPHRPPEAYGQLDLSTSPICAACHCAQWEPDANGAARQCTSEAVPPSARTDAACLACHEAKKGTHPVGVELTRHCPTGLLVSEDGKLSCLTCHRNHGELTADEPWASVSLLDRIFGTDRTQKSYLLRKKNVGGALCTSCHGTNEGSHP